MHRLSQTEPFSHLRKLKLGGLSLLSDDLLVFVQKHKTSLREISLNNIQAVDSAFAPLLEFLASQHCAVERIHLEDLIENRHTLLFRENQKSQCTTLSGDWQLNVIDRWGADVKMCIQYYPPKEGPKMSLSRSLSCRGRQTRMITFGSSYAGMPWWKE